ncbi:MAG: hypothetical protein GY869_24360, partial [Planctomycetes bacterium]|nr:hypothetical protein [Planctomycetota bacterium]
DLLDEKGRVVLGDYRIGGVKGPMVLKSNLVAEDLCQHWHFELEGDEATFQIHQVAVEPNEVEHESMVWDKPMGHRLGVRSDFDLSQTYNVLNTVFRFLNKSPESSNVVMIKAFDLWASNSQTSATGKLVFENGTEDFWEQLNNECLEVDLDWQVRLNHDSPGREDCPGWFAISEQLKLAGQTNIWGSVKWKENTPKWEIDGVLDFSEAGFDIASEGFDPEGAKINLVKPIGDDLKINYDFDYQRDEQRLAINRWQMNFGENLLLVRGSVTGIDETVLNESSNTPGSMKAGLSVSLMAMNVEQLAGWIRPIDEFGFSGHLTALADFEIEFGDHQSVTLRQLGVNGLIEGTMAEKPVLLDIQQAVFTPLMLQIPAVRFKVGENELSVVAEVEREGWRDSVHREGRIDIIGEHLDVDDLLSWQEQLLAEWRGKGMIAVKEQEEWWAKSP